MINMVIQGIVGIIVAAGIWYLLERFNKKLEKPLKVQDADKNGETV